MIDGSAFFNVPLNHNNYFCNELELTADYVHILKWKRIYLQSLQIKVSNK